MELFVFAFGALISILNPLGTVPIFVGLTQNDSLKEKSRIAFWTAVNVLIVLALSFFAGKYILGFFGISLEALKIAGGLIIASSGFALLTGRFTEHKGMKKSRVKEDIVTRSEISLTPLAIPMLAGPGSISVLITYNQTYTGALQQISVLAAILAAGISIYLILKSSSYIVKFLGASGINALSRVIGFIVIALGVEMVINPVLQLMKGVNLG